MECVAYMRVSTDKQAEEGYGLDSQKRDIEDYCKKNGMKISEWYVDDGYSGKDLDRPMMQQLITDCGRKTIKCVVTYALDRIARSTFDTIYVMERVFQKNGVELKCVHNTVHYETPSEQFQTQIIAAVAEYERKNIILRMRGGLLERVKQGYWFGGCKIPYCYRYDCDDGILKVIPERKEKAIMAMQMYLDGCSYKTIRKTLGFRSDCVVYHLLTGKVNIGMIPYRGQFYKGKHEPIFDKDTFELAQVVRESRRKAPNKDGAKNNLLSGLCYCGVCGCKMRYQRWANGKSKLYCYSRDRSMAHMINYDENCNNTLEWAEDIEKQVEDEILQISVSLSDVSTTKMQSRIEAIEERIEKETRRLKRLYTLYADGNDTVLEMIKSQEEIILSLKTDLKKERCDTDTEKKQSIVLSEIKNLADVWKNIGNKEKNYALKIIISKIIIHNKDVEIILNDC